MIGPFFIVLTAISWTVGQELACPISDNQFPCDANLETCAKRKHGSDRYTCICDSSYCDDLGQLPDPSDGLISIYESNQDGLRFRKNYINKNGASSLGQVPSKTAKSFTITVDQSKRHQSIWGFGGAFTDATGINLGALDESLSRHVIDDYFSTSGIGYSVGRVPVGGSDFSDRPYTYDDDHLDDFDLGNFTLAKDDYKYKIPYIKQALKLNPVLKLFASAWSPPAWMKTSNSISKRGWLKDSPGEPYHQSWAKYYAKFFSEYQANGIEFWGLTTGNEPISSYLHSTFNGLTFSPSSQRDFIKKDLAPVLAEAGFPLKEKLKLLIFDDQLPAALAWVGTILKDNETNSLVSGVAFHWYANFITPKSVLSLLSGWYPDQLWISSEACEGYRLFLDPEKVSLGNWGRGENYASDIISDLNHGAHGWVDWNMALDTTGGPNWANNRVDSPIIVNVTSNEYYRQPMYYSLAHLAKFLPPGSSRLETEGSHGSVEYTVFQRPDNNIVVVILNKNKSPIDVTIKGAFESDINWQVTAKSVTTIYGKPSKP